MGQSNKAKNKNKNEEDQFKIGTVLFTSGDAKHSDVWDDSELIDHWDKNVEAYRNRYSNQVKNESVTVPFQQNIRKTQEGHIIKKKPVLRKKSEQQFTSKENHQHPIPSYPMTDHAIPMPPMPPMPQMGSNQEDLSNLMMAWYYCGYYTALYQTQQQ